MRPRYAYVHLPANQIYLHLHAAAENTIRMEACSVSHVWTINGIRRYLLRKYGGLLEDYKVKHDSSRAILVMLPAWLMRDTVMMECNEWATRSGLRLEKYDDGSRKFAIPRSYMVRLKISQYPLALWHQYFFSLSLASMGELVEVHEVNQDGEERAFLRVWIHCKDPYRIPEFLVMDVADRWVMCPVQVETWYPLGPTPPDEPSSPPDNENLIGDHHFRQFPAAVNTVMLQLLLRSHDRWTQFCNNRSSAPAATGEGNLNTQGHQGLTWSQPQSIQVGSVEIVSEENLTRQQTKSLMGHTHCTKGGFIKLSPDEHTVKVGEAEVLDKKEVVRSTYLMSPDSQDPKVVVRQGDGTDGIKTPIIKVGSIQIITAGTRKETHPVNAGPSQTTCNQMSTTEPKGNTLRSAFLENSKLRKWATKSSHHSPGSHKDLGNKKGTNERIVLIVGQFVIAVDNKERGRKPKKMGDNLLQVGKIVGHESPTAVGEIGLKCKDTYQIKCKELIRLPFKTHQSCLCSSNLDNSLLKTQTPSMNLTDEELIRRFSTLRADGGQDEERQLVIPVTAVSKRNWNLCVVARVVTDRMMVDSQFIDTMMRVWNMGAQSSITVVAKATYLIQFTEVNEMCNVIDKGVWTYKNDLIAFKQASKPNDLTPEFVQAAEMMVQLHNLPPETFSQEGLLLIMQAVGTVLTEVTDFIQNGKKVYRAKVLITLNQPLKDKVIVSHPTLGPITTYLLYERLHRACLFCGLMGHEMSSCATKLRIARLKLDERHKERPEMVNILEPKIGAWITNLAKIPKMNRAGTVPSSDTATDASDENAGSYGSKQAPLAGDKRHRSTSQRMPIPKSTDTGPINGKVGLDLHSILGQPPIDHTAGARKQAPKRSQELELYVPQVMHNQGVMSARDDEGASSQTAPKKMKAGSEAPPPWT
jgi:Domain of unknown function (DUF4283)